MTLTDDPTIISLDELQAEENADESGGNETLIDPASPQIIDEQSIGGHMPDPESDDDTLESAHMMGIGLDEDEENPQPLNIAQAVQKAEEEHRNQ